MNKTFTAALAISAISGLALATSTVDTPPAGYEEKNAGADPILVCNPFASFDNGLATTLADIDGSSIGAGYIRLINNAGRVTAYAYWHDGAWYSDSKGGTSMNGTTLDRGTAIQFSGSSNYPLVLSGPLTNEVITAKDAVPGGYVLVGNASPASTNLAAFVISGNYDYNKDYVCLNGTKYVFKSGHWYTRDTSVQSDNVSVAAGDGLFLYCQKRKRGEALNATITIPSTY